MHDVTRSKVIRARYPRAAGLRRAICGVGRWVSGDTLAQRDSGFRETGGECCQTSEASSTRQAWWSLRPTWPTTLARRLLRASRIGHQANPMASATVAWRLSDAAGDKPRALKRLLARSVRSVFGRPTRGSASRRLHESSGTRDRAWDAMPDLNSPLKLASSVEVTRRRVRGPPFESPRPNRHAPPGMSPEASLTTKCPMLPPLCSLQRRRVPTWIRV